MKVKKLNEENKVIYKEIGAKLRAARLAKKLSIKEFADMVGIKSGSISKYELGQDRISIDNLLKVSKFLNVNIMSFFKENIKGVIAGKDSDTIYIGTRIPKYIYDELKNKREEAEKKGFKLTTKDTLTKAFLAGLEKAEKDLEELKKEQKSNLISNNLVNQVVAQGDSDTTKSVGRKKAEKKIPFVARIPESLYNELKKYLETYADEKESINDIMILGARAELEERLKRHSQDIGLDAKKSAVLETLQKAVKELEKLC
jgi:transcriptional regulator with XRE-family HTH domain